MSVEQRTAALLAELRALARQRRGPTRARKIRERRTQALAAELRARGVRLGIATLAARHRPSRGRGGREPLTFREGAEAGYAPRDDPMFLASTAGDISATLGGVVAAALGVWGAYIGSRKVRQETVPGQTQAVAAAGEVPSPGAGPGREVEGYIVRFIILYLVFQLWSAFLNVANPFLHFGSLGGSTYIDIGSSLVYVLIFLLLGLPLLVDISRRYSIRPRPRLRRRTR